MFDIKIFPSVRTICEQHIDFWTQTYYNVHDRTLQIVRGGNDNNGYWIVIKQIQYHTKYCFIKDACDLCPAVLSKQGMCTYTVPTVEKNQQANIQNYF